MSTSWQARPAAPRGKLPRASGLRRAFRPRERSLALTMAVSLALAGSACAPRTETDCDQLIADRNYAEVVNTCEDPSAVAMGNLGLAGFDFINFLVAEDPGNIPAVLGLSADNISIKRELINSAIRAVATPSSTKQAFLLLLGAFLGLSVTTAEFLDNGIGATALDNVIATAELQGATGLTVRVPPPPVPLTLDPGLTFQMVVGGQPYVVDCGVTTVPACSAPGNTYEDTEPFRGAGLDVKGPLSAPPSPTQASAANQMVMLLDFDLPITIDEAKLDRLDSFLGEGTLDPNFPEQNPGLFPIGLLGYLGLLDLANARLVEGAGGEVEGEESAQSTLDDTVDALRAKLDNGAACFKPEAADALKVIAAIPLNILYGIYRAAPGTERLPVPSPEDYTAYNIIGREILDSNGDTFVDSDPKKTLRVPVGSDYAFGTGTLSMGFKLLFPTQPSVGSFNRDFATPRIDQTPDLFRKNFEFIPRVAPNAAQAGDGRVDIIELICSAAGA